MMPLQQKLQANSSWRLSLLNAGRTAQQQQWQR
jgi:hypothetical protein